MVNANLRDFSSDSWLASRDQSNSIKGKTKDRQTSSGGGSFEWVCTNWEDTVFWIYHKDLNQWGPIVIAACTAGYYDFVEEEGDLPGGGTPGGGDDPSPPCDDPTQVCVDGPGGPSGPNAPEPDPCEGDNPPDWCACEDTGDPNLDNEIIKRETHKLMLNSSANDPDQYARQEQGMW